MFEVINHIPYEFYDNNCYRSYFLLRTYDGYLGKFVAVKVWFCVYPHIKIEPEKKCNDSYIVCGGQRATMEDVYRSVARAFNSPINPYSLLSLITEDGFIRHETYSKLDFDLHSVNSGCQYYCDGTYYDYYAYLYDYRVETFPLLAFTECSNGCDEIAYYFQESIKDFIHFRRLKSPSNSANVSLLYSLTKKTISIDPCTLLKEYSKAIFGDEVCDLGRFIQNLGIGKVEDTSKYHRVFPLQIDGKHLYTYHHFYTSSMWIDWTVSFLCDMLGYHVKKSYTSKFILPGEMPCRSTESS